MTDDQNRTHTIGYMCRTDFEHELGAASDGVRVFPSIESVRDHLSCAKTCGITKVSVSFVETAIEGTGEDEENVFLDVEPDDDATSGTSCKWPNGACLCAEREMTKPDPRGRVWMHCEEGLNLSKASMSRFIMFCLESQ